jgi:membrane protein implicated in regulation of membrane protease activity
MLMVSVSVILCASLVVLLGAYGLLFGLMASGPILILIVAMSSFSFESCDGTAQHLYDIGRALRLHGVRIVETNEGILIPGNALYTIEVRSSGKRGAVSTKYKANWTGTALVLMLLPLLSGYGAAISIVLSFYVLFDVRRSFARLLKKIGSAPLPELVEKKDDIGQLLMFTIADANRIAWDVRNVKHSRYQDLVIFWMVVLGLIGTLVFSIVFWSFSGTIGLFEFTSALVVSAALTIIAILLTRSRMLPGIRKADHWVERLEAVQAREESGVSVDGESTIGLLIEVGAELPEWLQTRDKGHVDNSGAMWLLTFFLVLPSAYLIANGVMSLLMSFSIQWISVIWVLVGVALAFASYLVYRHLLRQERIKSHNLRKEWERRQKYLTRRLEEVIEGM